MTSYFDAHSHLHFDAYDNDREAVLARMQSAGVGTLLVGTNKETSRSALRLAEKGDAFLWATVGLHPNETSKERFAAENYKDLVTDPKVVAVGECGLDYYRNDPTDKESKRKQHEQFERQVAFALEHDKPLMLHCRPSKGRMDAYEDVIALLRGYSVRYGAKLRGDVHFFVGTTEVAKQFLELGFTLSFTGVVTFARDYDEVIRYVPSDMILSETDAPFVAPEPHRGKRNEPTHVVRVVEKLASVRDEPIEMFKRQILKNAKRIFALS